jgi:RimJ/RimL family protein N-acetyltransferase
MSHLPRPAVVSGDRIYLSHFTRDDVSTLTRWFSSLEVTAYVGMQGRSFIQEQEQAWYDNYVKPSAETVHFAVIDAVTHAPIGTVSLMDIRQLHQRAELGIVIGEPAYWSRGYGREAIELMCQYGFAFLNLHTIYLWYVSYNTRARKSYEAVGFVETGRIPAARLFNGQRYDDVVMTRHAGSVAALAGKYGLLPL